MIKKGIFSAIVCFFLIGAALAQNLSALTYNLRYDTEADGDNRWDNRKEFLTAQLRFYRPDVFGTQEGLVHQLQFLKEGLKTYEYFGKGRDKGDDAGEFSAIFYNTETLKLMEEHTFWLSETPEVPSRGWDAALNRVCTYGLFKTREKKRSFYVFNVHLDHLGEEARKESVRLVLNRIQAINTKNLPVILMGDFNLEPGHEAILSLSKQMTDAHTLAGDPIFGPPGTFNGFSLDEVVRRRIDYLFLSRGGFDLLRYGILTATLEGRYPSDHFPVFAELAFK